LIESSFDRELTYLALPMGSSAVALIALIACVMNIFMFISFTFACWCFYEWRDLAGNSPAKNFIKTPTRKSKRDFNMMVFFGFGEDKPIKPGRESFSFFSIVDSQFPSKILRSHARK